MKRNFECLMMMAVLMIVVAGGCKKKANTQAAPAGPDVSNFSATAPAAYTAGNAGKVVVNATSLAEGSYTLKYHYTKDTSTIKVQGDLTISNHSGSFETPALTNVDVTYLTIDSLINSLGVGAAVTTGNLVTLVDSNGLMTVQLGNNSYNALYLNASIFSNALSISGIYFYPGSKTNKVIWFDIQNYTGVGTYALVGNNGTASSGNIDNNGSVYSAATSRYGTFTITATMPKLTGNFSFTAYDSTKVSGSFSAPGL